MLPSLNGEPPGAQRITVMKDNVARMKRMWATLDLKMKPVVDWLSIPMHVLDTSNQKDMEYIIKLVKKVAERSLPENRRSLLSLAEDLNNMSSFLLRNVGSASSQEAEDTKRNLEEKLINVLASILKAIKKLQSATNREEKKEEKNSKGQKKNSRKRKCKSDDDDNMKGKKIRRC